MTSQNNLKHGYYCKNPVFDDTAAFRAFMKAQRRHATRQGKESARPPTGGC